MSEPMTDREKLEREYRLIDEVCYILRSYGFDSIHFDGTTSVSRDRIKVYVEEPDSDKPVNEYLFFAMRIKLNSIFRELRCISYPQGSSDDTQFDSLWVEEDYQEKDFDPAEWANILHIL